MNSPEAEPVDDRTPLRDLLPVYHLTEGLSGRQVMQNLDAVMGATAEISDPLPAEIRTQNRLATLGYALRNIHNPVDFTALAAAKKRLIFDEFFYFALGLTLTKKERKAVGAPACTDTDLTPFFGALPYRLTGAQERAIREITADMAGTAPMSRIVVGDVGCGKTAVAAAAIE